MNKLMIGLFLGMILLASHSKSETLQESNGLQFNVVLDDKSLTVKLEFKNISDKTIYFFFSECPVEFLRFSLYDNSEKLAYYHFGGVHEALCRPTNLEALKPGENFIHFTAIDLESVYSAERNQRIHPLKGHYLIQYSYAIPQAWSEPHYQKMNKDAFQGHENDYWKGHLISNLIPIDIE